MDKYEPLMESVNEIMRRLSFSILPAKLRNFTQLVAKTRNSTHWSSTFQMVERFLKIREFLRPLQDMDVNLVLLSNKQEKELGEVFVTMQRLEKVTKGLQSERTMLMEVRGVLVKDYQDTAQKISANGSLVQHPSFEAAVVKVLKRDIAGLSNEERESVKHLIDDSTLVDDGEEVSSQLDYFEQATKKQKLEVHRGYLTLEFLCPTSNLCERFFSWANHAHGGLRGRMRPRNFETQMFLCVNNSLWDVVMVE
ncbi:hypothetical protein AeRB84_004990 [Aphanomyces euteiches]|nr:hypothetical protein AeRB84_004990 [Aphanomyces euteiches]